MRNKFLLLSLFVFSSIPGLNAAVEEVREYKHEEENSLEKWYRI